MPRILSLVTLTVLAIMTASLAVSVPAKGEDTLPSPQPSATSVREQEEVRQVGQPSGKEAGGSTPTFQDQSEQIGEAIEPFPAVFAGFGMSSDDSYFEVFVKEGRLDEARELLLKEGVDPVLYRLIPRRYSTEELGKLRSQLVRKATDSNVVLQSVGIDPAKGGLRVRIQVDPEDAGSSARAKDQAVSRASEALNEFPVVSVEFEEGRVESMSSLNDSGLATGGARITNSVGDRCTASFGITLSSGKKGQLTAGHCLAGRWYTNFTSKTNLGRFVGSQFTTAYPGNAGSVRRLANSVRRVI